MLYTRMRDGGQRVTQDAQGHWKVGGRIFPTKKELLLHVTGSPYWSWDRYFRQGRYAPKTREGIPNLLEWLMRPLPGIDLENRSGEVSKLLFSGFGSWIFSSGYDPDDVFQEVCKGILARNRGKCPWDPGKSSFGHYVHMVCAGVVSNFHRKKKRVRDMERVGTLQINDGELQVLDVGGSQLESEKSPWQMDVEMGEAKEDLERFLQGDSLENQVALKAIPLLIQGYSRGEIAERLGVTPALASRGLAYLRRQAMRWSQVQF